MVVNLAVCIAGPSLFDRGNLNEAMAKQMLGNGLGTYAFLDEFLAIPTPCRHEVAWLPVT